MGHRALVAYERTDGQCTLHYSHWDAASLKLKQRITAETPFGGEGTDSKWAKQLLAELADGLEADAVDGYLAGLDEVIQNAWEAYVSKLDISELAGRIREHSWVVSATELPAGVQVAFERIYITPLRELQQWY